MELHEKFRKFPIKFFQNINTDKVEYESGFTQGKADSLSDAFKVFDTDEFVNDLYYYYDDVIDVRIGRFIPSLTDKIVKGRKYLGMLELELDLQKTFNDSQRTVSYLAKNRHEIPNHLQYIKKLKQSNATTFKDKLTAFVNYIRGIKMHEMFFPFKTANQLICKHCGKIIEVGTYYESYRGDDYHIECIWDKLINKMPQNSYEQAETFFFSLKQYIGDWPGYGFDVEEDYLTDLELVEHNNRILNREPFKEYSKIYSSTLEYYRKLYETL